VPLAAALVWNAWRMLSAMATVLVRVADIGGLHSANRALTTGGIDTADVTVRAGARGPSITIRVDRASVWRFRLFHALISIRSIIAIAALAGSALAYGVWRNWVLALALWVLGLALAGLEWALRPEAYPLLDRDGVMLRLRGARRDRFRSVGWGQRCGDHLVSPRSAPESE
jgi:hypothetical protein